MLYKIKVFFLELAYSIFWTFTIIFIEDVYDVVVYVSDLVQEAENNQKLENGTEKLEYVKKRIIDDDIVNIFEMKSFNINLLIEQAVFKLKKEKKDLK